MRFSTAFALLAAATGSVDAWSVWFSEDGLCSLQPGKSKRALSSDHQGDCYTFGADMPGVSCTETTISNKGNPAFGPCGNPPWRPHSLEIVSGRGCTMFMHPNCEGPRWDTGKPFGCLWRESNGDSTIRSFRCYD
ncbi:hypothetical protein FOQG_19281 [Fusarium oxysporum f. sp. raphani 54005]|uniref:Uncharacterized protein n=7 Tax=Fusarium TaxID=5506 RepID=X0BBS2_FUSOX|nr:uncharacterized protein BKA55DRAFT_595215 [Fusarium redolens]EGU73387.1 hypothetical protein FOXB_16104 [Fusarium oxysporum f. sp. conglutinans Fo5176]EXK75959.1 hypothetical protein FOQG_19281 [Fusarium oxysporum f. sp. raphani 54005]EXL64957.1 hypothetical protein FOPG_18799 [Fusarium oxysporum f. sp. conglutinans race 2 54008]KAF6512772.1 hypothetical protein HZS61_007578 [Fusarium oxysporum f. sp. conglutinans]KAG7423566.1 hypothetical protein Forpi1262_v015200 [Fusarium oxysporum f. sp